MIIIESTKQMTTTTRDFCFQPQQRKRISSWSLIRNIMLIYFYWSQSRIRLLLVLLPPQLNETFKSGASTTSQHGKFAPIQNAKRNEDTTHTTVRIHPEIVIHFTVDHLLLGRNDAHHHPMWLHSFWPQTVLTDQHWMAEIRSQSLHAIVCKRSSRFVVDLLLRQRFGLLFPQTFLGSFEFTIHCLLPSPYCRRSLTKFSRKKIS